MKKTMLTILCAVSAIMAFAAAKEARIDIYNPGKGRSMKVADKGTAVSAFSPTWTQHGVSAYFTLRGNGWQTGTVTLTAVGDGRLQIQLMGPYIRINDDPKNLQKVYVDYSKVVVNGKTVYEGKGRNFQTVWHNAPYIIKDIRVKDGETVKIEATFRPTKE